MWVSKFNDQEKKNLCGIPAQGLSQGLRFKMVISGE
jgi:hypothetical protein